MPRYNNPPGYEDDPDEDMDDDALDERYEDDPEDWPDDVCHPLWSPQPRD